MTRSKQGQHRTSLSACSGFLGFVGEAIVTHGEKWEVLGKYKVSKRKFTLGVAAPIFWGVLCDFVSILVRAVPCASCPYPLSYPTSALGRIN